MIDSDFWRGKKFVTDDFRKSQVTDVYAFERKENKKINNTKWQTVASPKSFLKF